MYRSIKHNLTYWLTKFIDSQTSADQPAAPCDPDVIPNFTCECSSTCRLIQPKRCFQPCCQADQSESPMQPGLGDYMVIKLFANSLPRLTYLRSQCWNTFYNKVWRGQADQAWSIDHNNIPPPNYDGFQKTLKAKEEKNILRVIKISKTQQAYRP